MVHPLYKNLCTEAERVLTNAGYKAFKSNNSSMSWINEDGVTITVLNQGQDFPEVYVSSENDERLVRLDFILELYITGDNKILALCKKNKFFYDFKYQEELLNQMYDKVLSILEDRTDYDHWVQSNFDLITKQAKTNRTT